jgi:hypothetical protein
MTRTYGYAGLYQGTASSRAVECGGRFGLQPLPYPRAVAKAFVARYERYRAGGSDSPAFISAFCRIAIA